MRQRYRVGISGEVELIQENQMRCFNLLNAYKA